MCKQAIFPEIPSNTNTAQLWKFVTALRLRLQVGNPHGTGLAAISQDGQNLGAYRWLNPSQALTVPRQVEGRLSKYGRVLQGGTGDYWHSGANLLQAPVSALMLHTRYATSGKGLAETHPHLDDPDASKANVCLVHNGVIRSSEYQPMARTECDSELLVIGYLMADVVADFNKLNEALDEISGYYAFGAFVRQEQGWAVDIVKDSRASLSACYVPNLDLVCFVTDPDDVRNTCKSLRFKAPEVSTMKDNVAIRCMPKGEILSQKLEQSGMADYGSYLGESAEVQRALAGGYQLLTEDKRG